MEIKYFKHKYILVKYKYIFFELQNLCLHDKNIFFFIEYKYIYS